MGDPIQRSADKDALHAARADTGKSGDRNGKPFAVYEQLRQAESVSTDGRPWSDDQKRNQGDLESRTTA